MIKRKNLLLTCIVWICACFLLLAGMMLTPKAQADAGTNPEKITIISPESSANFATYAKKTGGVLTELNGENVFYGKDSNNDWYGFSYNQIVSEYTATIEFKSSAPSSRDVRIYLNSASIGGASDYLLRFYQNYVMVYEPDRSGWFTATDYIFKANTNYCDGNWHTFTVSLYGSQFFLTLDGQFIPNDANMKNPDKYSANTNHLYTNNIKDATTSELKATEIDSGYIGIYGCEVYVRRFEVDLYDTSADIGRAQFSASYQVYTYIESAKSAGYTDEQFATILALGKKAVEDINLAESAEEAQDIYTAFTKKAANVIFDDYEYQFSVSETPTADFSISGGSIVTENGCNSIVAGDSWTVASYKGALSNYAQFTTTVTLGVSAGDVRIYFYTNEAKDEGYLLRFYSGMTILYQSPFLLTADYWNYPQNGSGVIKRSDIDYQDGKTHTIAFAYYQNQFYLTIDGELFVAQDIFDTDFANDRFTRIDESGNALPYDYFSFGFAGKLFTVHEVSTVCYSLDETIGKTQFENVFAVYQHLQGMDKLTYGGDSWGQVLSVADLYVNQILAGYLDESVNGANDLLAQAISAINAVEPTLEFDINEDFEDGVNNIIAVKSGANAVTGTANNQYLSLTSTWNTLNTEEITKDYILSFDFRSGTSGALYFSFNKQEISPSRTLCYTIRLYASGTSQSVQLYKGVETEGGLSWIYTHVSSSYYRDDNWHNLKVISAEGKFTLYLDDVNIVPTSKSSSYTMEGGVLVDDTYTKGYFGMQSQSPVDFDNFSIQPVDSFASAVYTVENTEGNYYFQELDEIPTAWETEALLVKPENSISALTLQNGGITFTKDKPVFSAHLAVTFKATEFDTTSRFSYFYTTAQGSGYRLDMTSAKMTLLLLNKDGTQTVLGETEFSFDILSTVRFLQYNGYTYVYCDDVACIAVQNTDFYQGALSLAAVNMTAEIYKVSVASSENLDVAKAELLPIYMSAAALGDKLLLGYQITGGGYDGLYNVNEGEALYYEDGMTFSPVMISMYMEMGASARIHTEAGLRWTTMISAQDYEMLVSLGATFGTRITSVGSEKYIDIPVVNGLIMGATEYHWNGALVDILPANYERIFLGTGYVSVPYANGGTVVKYAKNDDNYRTYKGIVLCALNDVSDEKTGKYQYQVTTLDGRIAYSLLSSTKYTMLKEIFSVIEGALGQTEIKINEWDESATVHDINVCYTYDGDDTTADYTGNALSVLIEYHDQAILIDAGTDTTSSIARITDLLLAEGVNKIDHLILTHEHQDHAGGMSAIVERFDVGAFYSRPSNVTNDWYKGVESAVRQKVNSDGTTVEFVYPNEEGWRVTLSDDTFFEFYNCTRIFDMQDVYTDGNYFSLEILFVSGRATAFFGGDAVGLTQNEEMLDALMPYGGVDVYQAQHHGTGGAYSPKALMDVIRPTYTLVPTAGTPAEITYTNCEPYGRVYVTGYVGTSSFDIGEDGRFEMRTDSAERWADTPRVSVQETELAYNGSNRTNCANIVADRGLYIVPTYGVATAIVYTVPENVTHPTVFTLRGSDVYRQAEGTGNIRFRLILNDKVLYSGDCSTARENLDVSITFTAKAGDKIYFAVDCTTQENSNTAVYMASAMYIDGRYIDVTSCNHINPSAETTLCSKNFFNGSLYNDNGQYYTYAELLSYVAIVVTDLA